MRFQSAFIDYRFPGEFIPIILKYVYLLRNLAVEDICMPARLLCKTLIIFVSETDVRIVQYFTGMLFG